MTKIVQTKHLELLQRLIRCKSITPYDDGALQLLETYLEKLGFKSIIKSFGELSEEVMNLYSVLTSDDKDKVLCFAGHSDVVPPGQEEAWSEDPFSGVVKEGYLYGRGAVDMKTAIIAFIAAAEYYLLLKKPFGGISFLITADEEGIAKHGTDPMIKWIYENQLKIDHCLVGEPVSRETIGDNIKIGARGSANFWLTIQGKQGHVAYDDLIDNPVRRASKILNDLLEYDFTHHNLIFDKTKVEFTKLDCDSGAENVVPNSIRMRFNFRYGDDYDYEKLKALVAEIVTKQIPNKDHYTIQSRTSGDAALWVKDSNSSELVSITKLAIQKVIGKTPDVTTYGGTSDARFIRKYCEVVEVGLLGTTAHQIDERVSLDDFETLAEIYLEIIINYFLK